MTDMKQNGEPSDVAPAADNGNQTNGDDVNGEKSNNEIHDTDDVEMSVNGVEHEHDLDDDGDINGENQYNEINDNHDVEMNADDEVNEDIGDNLDFVCPFRIAQLNLAKLSCFNPHLTRVMRILNPLFRPNHPQFKKDILKVFEEEKSRAKAALANLDSQICLSVDTFWSYKNQSVTHYLQLSAHFIDEEWKLKKWALKFCKAYSFDPNCEAFDEAVVNALKDWEIEEKIFSFTMAGVHSDIELFETFKTCVQEKKKLPLHGKLFGVDCCARIFDLMAEDAYKEIPGIISKVRWLSSWSDESAWYSSAYSLKEALTLESMGEFSSQKVRDLPSADEWEKARFVSNLVINLYTMVKPLFKTKYPTANIFLHKFQELRAMLFQEASSADDFKSKVAKKMLDRLDKYWDEMSLTLAIASVMDPRFKMSYFDYLSSKGEVSGNKLETSVILDAVRSLYGNYVDNYGEIEFTMCDESSSSESEDEPSETVPGDSAQEQEYTQFIESMNQSPKSDLDRYLEDPVVPLSQDFNALSWWRFESAKYPTLSKMARDILAIPMSVATSSQAFYKDREAQPRTSISGTDEMKNALMCAPTWAENR